MIRSLWFFWVLAWIGLGSVRAEVHLRVDVFPVWNGLYKAGQSTEVEVRLLAQKGGDYVISTGQLSATMLLKADIPSTIWLPLRPDASGAIDLKVYMSGEKALLGAAPTLLTLSKESHIAIVTDGLPEGAHESFAQAPSLFGKAVYIQLTSDALPHFGASYGAVDAVVMHFGGLKNLQDQQIQALSEHLMRCGRLIALAFPESIFNRLKQLSGCQGRFLLTLSSLDQLSGVSWPPSEKKLVLPDLASLDDSEVQARFERPNSWVAMFCLSYLIVGFIAVGVGVRRRILLMLPLIGAAVAILVWGHRQPQKVLTSWLEMDSGHTSARYSARLTLKGTGIWREHIELPVDADCSLGHSNQGRLLGADKDRTVSPIKYALLSEESCQWQSVTPIEAPLSLSVEENRPIVFNDGQHSTDPGLLRWQGRIYMLPPLQSGQKWTFSEAAGMVDHSKMAEVFAKQSRLDQAALLIPYKAPMLSIEAEQRGWLLIHREGGGA